ncbi:MULTISPECIES: fimbrial protein [Providencia]|uniref:fimbrial protein n=1 Tax=Providencia TaxID=586 RepID=UPI0023498920|nr:MULTISPECIES: fimbrial protein [Providencia]MDH2368149.1 fimbrial protein [Providencia rettgeri]
MRIFFSGVIGLLLGCVVTAQASDIRFDISGVIKNGACSVSLVNTPSVFLGTFSTEYLDNLGKTTPLVPFQLTVDDCPQNYTNVQVTFTGEPLTENPQLIALQAGGAKNVGIALYDSDKTSLIDINSASSGKIISTEEATTLTFYAAYQATGKVTEGEANADINFTLSYN